MTSFVSRSLVLAAARLLNQVLGLLSPLLLVRLLSVPEYGRFRQFTVTVMFVTTLAGFAVSNNLNYLIARSPERIPTHVTNACLLMLCTGAIGALFMAGAHWWVVPVEILEYWPLLVLYVFLLLNLEVPVSYWLAQGRSDQVMIYTLAVTVLRLGGVLGAALLSRNVAVMFITMASLEAVKTLCIYVWLRRRRLLAFKWDGTAFREQLRLVMPLGAGSLLYQFNEQIGKLMVSMRLGAAPTAIYTTAAYQIPLVGIVQGALSDVVFPDMVKRAQRDPAEGLRLWKRMNVLFFAVICPSWLLLTYFAEPLIRLLFTDAYAAATPYFQVFLLLMVRQCFHFSVPLRAVADNGSFAKANIAGLLFNVGAILLLMPKYGLWAPVLGLVVGQMGAPFYLGWRVMRRYQVPLSMLCEWRKLGAVLIGALLSLLALHVTQLYGAGTSLGVPGAAIVGLAMFALLYLVFVKVYLREEFDYIVRELRLRFFRARTAPGV